MPRARRNEIIDIKANSVGEDLVEERASTHDNIGGKSCGYEMVELHSQLNFTIERKMVTPKGFAQRDNRRRLTTLMIC